MEILIEGCKAREIDKFVKKVVDILEKYGKYVIVSGYVAIFCCRDRPTQDIDILYIPYSEKHFCILKENLEKTGLTFYGDLERFFKYKEPAYIFSDFTIGSYKLYFEIKLPKNELERLAINNRVKIRKEDIEMYFSPIELQIVYKLWLGSDKDILDASYLYNLFKDKLDMKELKKLAKLLDVEEELNKLISI